MQKAGRTKVVLDSIPSGNQFVAELYVSYSTIPLFFQFNSNLHFLCKLLTFFARILRAICWPCWVVIGRRFDGSSGRFRWSRRACRFVCRRELQESKNKMSWFFRRILLRAALLQKFPIAWEHVLTRSTVITDELELRKYLELVRRQVHLRIH